MTMFYIVQCVTPAAIVSYPIGRTLLNNSEQPHRDEASARRRRDVLNEYAPVGVSYEVVPCDDRVLFTDCDRFEKP